jgi:hypothetical protein
VAWQDSQTVPGLTERTIWSTCQVAVHRLPAPVTHTGFIHVQVDYTPADADLVICLLDAQGRVCGTTRDQGRLASWPGRTVIDHEITTVAHADVNAEGDDLEGDEYYVLVQALNAESRYRLTGYFPRVVPSLMDVSDATTRADTLRRQPLTIPAAGAPTARIYGAPYGGAFTLQPTSQGVVTARLESPANTTSMPRTVGPVFDPATLAPLMPANFEQYAYGPDWESLVLADEDETGRSHWDLYHENDHADQAPLDGGRWWGLESSFTVATGTATPPDVRYQYVPVLWLASSDPLLGPAAPPKTGRSTQGYKATLLIPQRLRLAAATARVRRGDRAILRGTLALPTGAAPADPCVWAPPGTAVTIERKLEDGPWRPFKTATVGQEGTWRTSLHPSRTAWWRASYGLAEASETSLAKRILVRR